MKTQRHIIRGTGLYHRANWALFIAGFVTFSTLYSFQPLLPLLSHDYDLTPAAGSLFLSVTTFALAWTLPISGTLSEAVGRRILMSAAIFLTSLIAVGTILIDSPLLLLGLRLVQGVVLAGVPAVAMAYLSEEIEPRAVGGAMGLYIAGNAFGGMAGRIGTAFLADFLPWREAVAAVGGVCLLLGVLFLLLLPRSRNFHRRPFRPIALTASLLGHLRDPGLLCLFTVAFTCMGAFVTLYNYVTFRLLAPPYALSQSQVALIFFAYAFGAFGSSAMGALADRLGRRRILFAALAIMAAGALVTLASPLPLVILGIVLFTVGFFAAHAVASAWVGSRAPTARAQASSLYLFFYYLGSSLSGTGGGFFWSAWGWPGLIGLILLLIAGAAAAGLRLTSLETAKDTVLLKKSTSHKQTSPE